MTAAFGCDNLQQRDENHVPLYLHMDKTEFTKIYSILGVFQDDGLEMIRAAYKKQIKRWHPDRFQDPNHRKIAEEKSKEINYAYQKLTEYYEKFGELPPDHCSETTSTFGDQESTESMPSDARDPAHSYASHAVSATRQRSFIPIILIGVFIGLGYSIWEPTSEQSGPAEIDLVTHPGIRVNGNTLKPDDELQDTDSIHVANNLNNPNNASSWNEEANRYQKTGAVHITSGYKTAFEFDTSSSAAPNSPVTLIKRGSTKNDVLAVQGPPQRQTDSAWDYGASRIYFEGGQVSGWHENPLNPLSVVR